MTDQKTLATKAFVVEHLDPELGPWSALEYAAIARESHASGARFLLSSVPAELQMPPGLAATKGLEVEQRSVEEIFADRKDKVCLLDPAATTELSPEDGDVFEVFLFGGILGMKHPSCFFFFFKMPIECIFNPPPFGDSAWLAGGLIEFGLMRHT
jgi:ribosome biogenesis SPOUT family RNA methylase Rps3